MQRFKISLRIRHPSLDPSRISAALAIQPTVQWKAGDRRVTPAGKPLKGVHRETYWCARLAQGDEALDLPGSLWEHLTTLSKHSDFLKKMRSTGGEIEFFIGWFVEASSGAVFAPALLRRLATLGISLSLDVYPSDDLVIHG